VAVVFLGQHQVHQVRDRGAPLLADALALKAALADADRAIWHSYVSGTLADVGPGQTYLSDVSTAAALAEHMAEVSPETASLQGISGQLQNYESLVEQADATFRVAVATRSIPQRELARTYLTYATNLLRHDAGNLIDSINEIVGNGQQPVLPHRSGWTRPAALSIPAAALAVLLGSLLWAQVVFWREFRRAVNPALLASAGLTVALAVSVLLNTAHADGSYGQAVDRDVPALTDALRKQTAQSSDGADRLRRTLAGKSDAPDPAPARLLRRDLNQYLDDASTAEGLRYGLVVLAALTSFGLVFVGFRGRLHEYAGWR
jgi:hypothetical protein